MLHSDFQTNKMEVMNKDLQPVDEIQLTLPQAYIPKMHTLIQELPPANAYTKSLIYIKDLHALGRLYA